MEAAGATDVGVVLGEFGRGQGKLVPVAAQDGPDLFEPVQSFAVGDPAAGVQSLRWVSPAQVE